MNILIFGATGMVGQGVLRQCLLDPEVRQVVTIGRTATGQRDLFDYTSIESELTGFDACFFCLGVSSFRMSEADYAHVTYDLTLAAARTLARLNPQMVFEYVSGAHTDSTGKGSSMWARVKGRTENALLNLPFKGAYMFRPGAIQPMDGIRSKTALYQTIYSLSQPLWPLLRRAFPNAVTSTTQLSLAMLDVAKQGAPTRILEMRDIVRY
jgi:uncharacterized protein YbjT (DUF2867 family)